MNYNYYDNLNTFNGLNGMDNLLDENFLNQPINANLNNSVNYNNNIKLGNVNNMMNNLDLYEPLEGYARGNMFKNLYDSYKNYRPQRIKINSEQEELLAGIGEYSFAAHEMNLYLDVNPNNQNALNLFNKYRNQAKELMEKYERKYGPLTVSGDGLNKIPFAWEATSWPWEV